MSDPLWRVMVQERDAEIARLTQALSDSQAHARKTESALDEVVIAHRRAVVRLGEAENALLAVSTDNAQDALEDPVGHAEREAAGFYRIGKGAIGAVRRAVAFAAGAQDGKGTP